MQVYVSSTQSFNPKLIVLGYDVPLTFFKEIVQDRIFSKRGSTANSFQSDDDEEEVNFNQIKIFTFTGMEIINDDELNMLENNAYLFASQGETFDGKACLGAFHKIRLLGEGGYGKVYLALNRMTKEEVAIKFLKVNNHNADTINKLYKEADALRSLCHRNIIRLKFTFPLPEQRSIVIVMEYASGGELKGYLTKRGKLDEEEAKEIFYQLIEAVNYCHQKKIIHRDLKLNNIVFTAPNSRDIRVIDFGIHGLYVGNFPEKSLAGSLKYMAPEILTGKRTAADPCFDIFSIGCILFALVTGELPFEGDQDTIKNNIIKGKYSYPQGCTVTTECRDLIDRLLENNSHKRIFMAQIYKHPWIEQYALKFDKADLSDFSQSDEEETFSISKQEDSEKEDPAFNTYQSHQLSQDDINYGSNLIKGEMTMLVNPLDSKMQTQTNFEMDPDGQLISTQEQQFFIQRLAQQKLALTNQKFYKSKNTSDPQVKNLVQDLIVQQQKTSEGKNRNVSLLSDQKFETSPIQDKINQNEFELKKRKQKSLQRNTLGQFVPYATTHERVLSNIVQPTSSTIQPLVVVNNYNINSFNLSKHASSQQSSASIKFPDINTPQVQHNLRTKKLYESNRNSHALNPVVNAAGIVSQAMGQPTQFDEKSQDRVRKYIKDKIKESHDLVRPIGLTKSQKQQLNIFNKYLKELELKYDHQGKDSIASLVHEDPKKNQRYDKTLALSNDYHLSPKDFQSLSPIKTRTKYASQNNSNVSNSNAQTIKKQVSSTKRASIKKKATKMSMDQDSEKNQDFYDEEGRHKSKKKLITTQDINVGRISLSNSPMKEGKTQSIRNQPTNHKRSNSSFSQIPELQIEQQPSTHDSHGQSKDKKSGLNAQGSFRKASIQERNELGLTRYDSPLVGLRAKLKDSEPHQKQVQSMYTSPKHRKDNTQKLAKSQFGLQSSMNEKITASTRVLVVANEQRSEKLERQKQGSVDTRKHSVSPPSPTLEQNSARKNWMYNSSGNNEYHKIISSVFGKKFMIESILTKCDNDRSPITVKHRGSKISEPGKGFYLKPQMDQEVVHSTTDQ